MAITPDEDELQQAEEFAILTGRLTAKALIAFRNELMANGLFLDTKENEALLWAAFVRTLTQGK